MAQPGGPPEHLPVLFPGYPGSYGLLADGGTKTAVVFVHGFWGDAGDTWLNFQQLIDSGKYAEKFRNVDLIFYDYPSTKEGVKGASEDLGEFVNRIRREGPWKIALDGATLRGLNVPPNPKGQPHYDDMLLVGHSLGGVLVRKLITVEADGIGQPAGTWPALLRRAPRLFAPAHAGFRHGDIVSSLASLSRVATTALAVWRYGTKVYGELQPGTTLDGLKEQMLFLRTAHPRCPALYAWVIWGKGENVVFDTDYPGDKTLGSVEGKDHETICKPTDEFDKPLEFVSNGLG